MDEIEGLQNYESARVKARLPADVRPCMMALIKNKGRLTGEKPFILACELHRVGRKEQQIARILSSHYVSESKIRGVLKSLKGKKYEYRCETLELRGFCLYESKSECWWFDKLPKESEREGSERDFWRYEWPKRLRRTEESLYLALRTIEIRRGYTSGSRLFVTWDQLYEASRITRCTIGKKLEALRKIGLVKYRPGEHRIKGSKGRATEVRRIMPIPRPSNS